MQLFEEMTIYPIDNETADIYGRMKAAILGHFGPKEKRKRAKTKLETLGFTDNDLWIAAAAIRNQCALVSNGCGDFVRLSEIESLNIETWWKPALET